MQHGLRYSVVIATYNRAADLRATLESLSTLESASPWEVVVADNNSSDDTAAAVHDCAVRFPVALRYVFEPVQGRSAALNAGIAAARGDIILTTDDDVRVSPDWMDRAAAALDRLPCGYVGGKVLPIWGGEPPAWLSTRPGPHWAVIALLDYGTSPLEFTTRMPLGVNMAFRREVFDTVGGWDPRIGRKAGTLLGQEVREWCIRARTHGVRGWYVPDMVVQHIIPAERLNKRYFRRWSYWRGISRALLYQQQGLDMESPQETRLDFSRVPHVAGVPRYLYRVLLRHARECVRHTLRRRAAPAFEHEMWVWMFAGILRQRWRDRRTPFDWSATRRARPHAGASEDAAKAVREVGARSGRFRYSKTAACCPHGRGAVPCPHRRIASSFETTSRLVAPRLLSRKGMWGVTEPGTAVQMLRFARWCRTHRIEIVHACDFYANIFGLPAAALARVPVRIASRRGVFVPERRAVRTSGAGRREASCQAAAA